MPRHSDEPKSLKTTPRPPTRGRPRRAPGAPRPVVRPSPGKEWPQNGP
jgi:hypothetical protein